MNAITEASKSLQQEVIVEVDDVEACLCYFMSGVEIGLDDIVSRSFLLKFVVACFFALFCVHMGTDF